MIALLYSSVGVILALGYIPQIWCIVTAQNACREVSMRAWSIWLYTSSISLVYSIIDVGDPKLIAVNGINLFCIMTIIALTLYKRRKYGKRPGVVETNFGEMV